MFDSGLGGLALTQAIIRRLPEYDYLYLGDTKRVPYGNRSQDTIHEFVSEALTYLFERDCGLIILACNTASAESLRKSQREYLPAHFPERRILGVLIPTVEAALEAGPVQRVGLLATASTVGSGAFQKEIERQSGNSTPSPSSFTNQNEKGSPELFSVSAPLLVPLLENDGLKFVGQALDDYLAPLIDAKVERIMLGCTHYSLLKGAIRARVDVPVLSQDEIVPDKLADYLARHPEIERRLSKEGRRIYHVTDLTPAYEQLARGFAGEKIDMHKVTI